jgi:hypothetical protein
VKDTLIRFARSVLVRLAFVNQHSDAILVKRNLSFRPARDLPSAIAGMPDSSNALAQVPKSK